jgi:DNA-binding protein HU-beta
MNKAELVDAVATAANLSKADAGRAVDAVVNSITSALKIGQQVSVVGFGTFGVKHRAARAGRNPRTGETIKINASNVPGFKAGKALKDAVN